MPWIVLFLTYCYSHTSLRLSPCRLRLISLFFLLPFSPSIYLPICTLQLDTAKATITTLQGIIDGLEQDLQAAQIAHTAAAGADAEAQTAAVIAAEENLRVASRALDEMQGRVESLECELATVRNSFEGLEAEAGALRDDLAEANVREHIATAHLTEVESGHEQLEVQLAALEGQLEGAVGEANDAKAAQTAAEGRTVAAEERAAVATQQAEVAEQRADVAEERADAAEGALAEAQTALAGAHGKCEQIGRSQEELDLQHKESERSVAAVSAQLGVKEGEISRLMALNTELNERAARAEQVVSVSQVGFPHSILSTRLAAACILTTTLNSHLLTATLTFLPPSPPPSRPLLI